MSFELLNPAVVLAFATLVVARRRARRRPGPR